MEKKSKKRRVLNTVAAAAVALCVLAVPTTIFADEIKDFFRGLLKTEAQPIAEHVVENIFSDENEHVKVQVNELVSDGRYVAATITYDALDEEGKMWLSLEGKRFKGTIEQLKEEEELWSTPEEIDAAYEKFSAYKKETEKEFTFANSILDIGLVTRLQPSNEIVYHDNLAGFIDGSYRAVSDYTTENSRTFFTSMVVENRDIDQIVFDYKMCGETGMRHTIFDLEPMDRLKYSVKGPKVGYDFVGERRKFATIETLEISPLAWQFNGHNINRKEISKEELEDESFNLGPDVKFYFKDGTVVESRVCSYGNLDNAYEWVHFDNTFFDAELEISSEGTAAYGSIKKNGDHYYTTVDPTQLESVEINGNMYEVNFEGKSDGNEIESNWIGVNLTP